MTAWCHSVIGRQFVGPSQQVHHPAKQHRIEKLQARDHQIGECQKTRNPDIAAKKAENATINSKEPHLPVLAKT